MLKYVCCRSYVCMHACIICCVCCAYVYHVYVFITCVYVYVLCRLMLYACVHMCVYAHAECACTYHVHMHACTMCAYMCYTCVYHMCACTLLLYVCTCVFIYSCWVCMCVSWVQHAYTTCALCVIHVCSTCVRMLMLYVCVQCVTEHQFWSHPLSCDLGMINPAKCFPYWHLPIHTATVALTAGTRVRAPEHRKGALPPWHRHHDWRPNQTLTNACINAGHLGDWQTHRSSAAQPVDVPREAGSLICD